MKLINPWLLEVTGLPIWIYFGINFFLTYISAQPTTDSTKVKSPNECPKSVDHCSKDMRTIINDTRFTFAQNDHQLDILCLHLNRTITCINKFIECDPMSNLKKDTFNGLLLLMDKLCSKSSKFRIEYLKHAECYHKLAPVYKKCYQLYYASEKQRIDLKHNISTSEHLDLWCCNYKNHRKCTTDPVRRSCGSAAANLAEQIVIISEGQDTLDHCPKHIITSQNCLKQWESLGLLVNTTYSLNGNIYFLSDDNSPFYPDAISDTSGSLSSLVISNRYHHCPLKILNKYWTPLSSISLLQLIALTVILVNYNYFDLFCTLSIKPSPSPSPPLQLFTPLTSPSNKESSSFVAQSPPPRLSTSPNELLTCLKIKRELLKHNQTVIN